MSLDHAAFERDAVGRDRTARSESQPESTPGSTRRIRWLVGTVLVALAVVVAVVIPFVAAPSSEPGTQIDTPETVALAAAPVDGWDPLLPRSGEPRPGFPTPMIRSADRTCFGFARVDFGADDLRPSLARCVDAADRLDAGEIQSLLTVVTGFDTWHVVIADRHIDSFEVTLTTGETVDESRIHLAGAAVALRLENERDLVSVEWSTPSGTFTCAPDAAAWRSARFCVDG